MFLNVAFILQNGATTIMLRHLSRSPPEVSPTSSYSNLELMHYSNRTRLYSAVTPSPLMESLLEKKQYNVSYQNVVSQSSHQMCDFYIPGLTTNINDLHDAQGYSSMVLPDPLLYPDLDYHQGLYASSAFWAVPFYSRKIMQENYAWSYILRRLLHLTGNAIVVQGHLSRSEEHSYAPPPPRNQTIIDLINEISCTDTNLLKCVTILINLTLDEGHIRTDVASDILRHFTELSEVYTLPDISRTQYVMCDFYTTIIDNSAHFTDKLDSKLETPVGRLQHQHDEQSSKMDEKVASASHNSLQILKTICPAGYETLRSRFLAPSLVYNDVIMIITFNIATYTVIPYMELLYRPTFPRIVYCGPKSPSKHTIARYKLVFIKCKNYISKKKSGFFNQRCLTLTRRMIPKADGYLVIADDAFLAPARLQNFPWNKIWHLPNSQIPIDDVTSATSCVNQLCYRTSNRNWIDTFQVQTQMALRDIDLLAQHQTTFQLAKQRLTEFTNGCNRIAASVSDVYYIPSGKAEEFVEVMEVYLEHEVFLEIAIPTVIHSIEDSFKIFHISGVYSWDDKRYSPWELFNQTFNLGNVFLHPVKLSAIGALKQPLRSFFCDTLLPFIYKE